MSPTIINVTPRTCFRMITPAKLNKCVSIIVEDITVPPSSRLFRLMSRHRSGVAEESGRESGEKVEKVDRYREVGFA
jgi:hypothetical protein